MHDLYALFIAAVSNGSQKLVWKQHEKFKTLIFQGLYYCVVDKSQFNNSSSIPQINCANQAAAK